MFRMLFSFKSFTLDLQEIWSENMLLLWIANQATFACPLITENASENVERCPVQCIITATGLLLCPSG